MDIFKRSKKSKVEKPKTLPQSRNAFSLPSPDDMNIMIRLFLTAILIIAGFNFSHSEFFRDYPLFGIDYLAESIISALATIIGFFTLPSLLIFGKNWVERLIVKTVSDIVSHFWDQQSQRIQQARRERQKDRARARSDKEQRELQSGIVLDTSMLIDGRILDLVKTGFLDNAMIVPLKVVDELHSLSDSKDSLKRQKGRRGLDILNDLRKHTRIIAPNIKGRKTDVDKALVRFAKNNKVRLMTLDYNLIKVAEVSGVKVLNLNELVNAMKTVLLPGEPVMLDIIQPGKERKQGIGYLEDGTMVVVENAKDKVGEKVTAKVTKVIQSPAGKIVFAK